MKKLMTEIFVSEEPRLRIRVCASYRFDLNGSVAPNGHRDFGAEYGDYLPNPHINDYNCMGIIPPLSIGCLGTTTISALWSSALLPARALTGETLLS